MIILLISENYMNSKYCLMEMGIAWANKNNIIPFLLSPYDSEILLGTPISNVQCIDINNESLLYNNFYAKMLVENNIIQRLDFSSERELLRGIKDFCKNSSTENLQESINSTTKNIKDTPSVYEVTVSYDYNPISIYYFIHLFFIILPLIGNIQLSLNAINNTIDKQFL